MYITTGLYLIYLSLPLILLLVGSFGDVWPNTLSPRGITNQWYVELWMDDSFRRAFTVSMEVVLATIAGCTLIAVPLSYAIYRSKSRGVKICTRIVFLLPIAVPPVVLAFGFILVFSSNVLPWLGSIWLLIAGHVILTLPYFGLFYISIRAHML